MNHETTWRSEIRDWGSVVCVSTADFDAPIWTNKQHIMSRLATEVPVLYINSLGLRRPRLSRRDADRIVARLRRDREPQSVATRVDKLSILSPKVLPFHGSSLVRGINRRLLHRQLAPLVETLPKPVLLWTYNPVVIDELDLDKFAGVVYHCVDDLASVPRVPVQAIISTEARLVARADATFASSRSLYERFLGFGSQRAFLVNNVADFEHFSRAREVGKIPDELSQIPQPRAVFAGALSDHKIDWTLLCAVAENRPDWQFVLIGPVGEEEAMEGPVRVAALSNVHVLGYRSYESLPDYLRACDVALIPYSLTRHTAAVFPLKTWEYLAAGLPVVSTPLPALETVDPPVTFARSPAEFAAALDTAGDAYATEVRLAAASGYTWDSLIAGMFGALKDA